MRNLKISAFLLVLLTVAFYLLVSPNLYDTYYLYGVIDKTGKIILKPQKNRMWDYSDGLSKTQVYLYVGFTNKSGEMAVKPIYKYADDFSEGLSTVIDVEEGSILIDAAGKRVSGFDNFSVEGYHEGLAIVRVDHKVGFADKTGKIVIKPSYDHALGFVEGLARAQVGGKWGYINKSGEMIIEPKWSESQDLCDFSEGLAAVKIPRVKNVWGADRWMYIDRTGKRISPEKYEYARSFSEGLAAVSPVNKSINPNKWGFIDRAGKMVIKPEFDRVGDFRDGLALVVLKNNKHGYINKAGQIVTNPTFDYAGDFDHGLAAVCVEEKYGYIDKLGNMVIRPQFEEAYNFSEGLAKVKVDHKTGYIDKTGKMVIKPQFDDHTGDFHCGRAIIVKERRRLNKLRDILCFGPKDVS